jgi:hypothetical protein
MQLRLSTFDTGASRLFGNRWLPLTRVRVAPSDAQPLFCRRRQQPRRQPLANIRARKAREGARPKKAPPFGAGGLESSASRGSFLASLRSHKRRPYTAPRLECILLLRTTPPTTASASEQVENSQKLAVSSGGRESQSRLLMAQALAFESQHWLRPTKTRLTLHLTNAPLIAVGTFCLRNNR